MTPFTLALRRLFERHPHANQTELARFVGVTPQAVQQWVAGATQPSPERIEKVAQFFGVRAADLLQRLANEEASAAERALKEALQAEGWTVEALRRLEVVASAAPRRHLREWTHRVVPRDGRRGRRLSGGPPTFRACRLWVEHRPPRRQGSPASESRFRQRR